MYMAKLNIAIPNCPDCNSPARGTVETLLGCAEFDFDSDGTAEYSGYTDACLDDQKTRRDSDGRVEMVCENGHHWFSKMEEISA
jgi:hypothetical protein